MTREELKDKLFELGIETENCFPKSTFPFDGNITVGLYDREMKEDFYFFGKYDKKIYVWRKGEPDGKRIYKKDMTSEKWMVPLTDCEIVWEDKPFVELPDAQYNTMTVRQFACIHLGVPETGIEWLDTLIRKSKQ